MISGFSQVLAAIEKGAKIKLVAATRFLVDDVIYSQAAGQSAASRTSKAAPSARVAGRPLHHMTVALMRKKGFDAAKVRFVNIGSSSDVFRAVVAGTVDAGIALNDVYPEHQEHYGVHALEDGLVYDELPEYTYQGSYASDRAIAASAISWCARSRPTARSGASSRARFASDTFVRARAAVTRHPTGAAEGVTEWAFIQKHKPYAVRPPAVGGTRALHAGDQPRARPAEAHAPL